MYMDMHFYSRFTPNTIQHSLSLLYKNHQFPLKKHRYIFFQPSLINKSPSIQYIKAKKQKNQSYLQKIQKPPPMESFNCPQKNPTSPYNYHRQIEQQIIKVINKNLPFTSNQRIIIRTVSRILKINLLQCSLITWLMNNPTIKQQQFHPNIQQLNIFSSTIDKILFILLLLNGFYVKSYLNTQADPQIDQEILQLIPNFKNIYQEWTPINKLNELTLKQVHQMFQQWTEIGRKGKKDYNFMVGKILQLSKSYNIGANDKIDKQKPSQSVWQNQQYQTLLHPQHNYQSNPHLNYQEYFNNDHYSNHQDHSSVIKLKRSQKRQQNQQFPSLMKQSQNLFDLGNYSRIDRSNIRGSLQRQKRLQGRSKQRQSYFDDL